MGHLKGVATLEGLDLFAEDVLPRLEQRLGADGFEVRLVGGYDAAGRAAARARPPLRDVLRAQRRSERRVPLGRRARRADADQARDPRPHPHRVLVRLSRRRARGERARDPGARARRQRAARPRAPTSSRTGSCASRATTRSGAGSRTEAARRSSGRSRRVSPRSGWSSCSARSPRDGLGRARRPSDRRAPAARRNRSLVALAVVLGASALILTLNAWRYPWDNGYDAHEHAAYADYVVERGAIPTDRTNEHYYTPPGYYAVAGAIDELGIAIGLREPQQRKLVQLFNVPLVLATALLTFLLARLLWPGRRLLQVAAAAFVAFTPVVVKTGAMFHPETLSLFLSTLGLYLAARLIARGRLGWLPGLALGAVLGAGQLVRSQAAWTFAAWCARAALPARDRRRAPSSRRPPRSRACSSARRRSRAGGTSGRPSSTAARSTTRTRRSPSPGRTPARASGRGRSTSRSGNAARSRSTSTPACRSSSRDRTARRISATGSP